MKRLAPILIVLGAGCGAGVTPPELDSRPDDAATKLVGNIGGDGGKGGGCAPGGSDAGSPRGDCDHPADLGARPESPRDLATEPDDVRDMAIPYKPDMAMGGNPPDLGMVGSVCTSNVRWTKGSQGSPQMRPGNACIACHKSNNRAPQFTIAGTIYPTLHEPTDCNGLDGTRSSVQVVITDKTGKVITLQPNSAGNFYSMSAIALPFRASIVSGNKKRDMVSAQSSGDCNSCHTENGAAGAPGRVMTP